MIITRAMDGSPGDVGEATEGLENELCSFFNPTVTSSTSQLIFQPFRCFTYVTAHFQPFHCFTYVTAHSSTLLSLLLHHLVSRPWSLTIFVITTIFQIILQSRHTPTIKISAKLQSTSTDLHPVALIRHFLSAFLQRVQLKSGPADRHSYACRTMRRYFK